MFITINPSLTLNTEKIKYIQVFNVFNSELDGELETRCHVCFDRGDSLKLTELEYKSLMIKLTENNNKIFL